MCHSSTFGLRHGKELLEQRVPSDNRLTLYYVLINGTTATYTYDVGTIIRYRGESCGCCIGS